MLSEVRLLNSQVKAVDSFIKLTGASCVRTDDVKEYHPIAPVIVNVNRISAFYDHTILMDGQKVLVMETMEDIAEILLENHIASIYV